MNTERNSSLTQTWVESTRGAWSGSAAAGFVPLFFCYFFSILLISEQSDRDFHSGLVSWRTAARRSAPTSKPSAWFDGGAVVKRNDWRAAGKSGHFSRHEEKPGVKEKYKRERLKTIVIN